jgi:hypothetical protein
MRYAVCACAPTDELLLTIMASIGFLTRSNFEQNLNVPIG